VTPATKLLDRAKVDYRLISYVANPAAESYGSEAIEATGASGDKVFKTLIATVRSNANTSMVVALVPVTATLNLKALAAAAGAKGAAMADSAEAERVTGYVTGGISPLGQRRKLATYVDSSARELETIYVSGGRRGLEIVLSPQDLLLVTEATVAPIATIGN